MCLRCNAVQVFFFTIREKKLIVFDRNEMFRYVGGICYSLDHWIIQNGANKHDILDFYS